MSDIRMMAERAHTVFDKEGWTWVTAEEGVPTVEEIEATLQKLTSDIQIDNETQWISTGRLRVERDVWAEEGTEPFVTWNYYLELDD